MRTRIVFKAPELSSSIAVELDTGQAALVGREPDLSKLSFPSFGLSQTQIKLVTVASPHVSSNHVLVQHRPEGIFLSDLNSRHGSWLRLVPGREVRFPVAELSVDLARPTIATTESAPPDVEWNTPKEYAAAMESALQSWLKKNGISASVRYQTEEQHSAKATLGLACGGMLIIDTGPGSTATNGWTKRAADWVHSQNVIYEQEQGHDEHFVMASAVLRRAHRQVAEAALRGQRLVLLGETGAGKEQFALCYHRHSRRSNGPFLVLNCGGLLNNELVHSELFGAQRGAFTGCVRDIKGAVEAAHGGTLVLDEIGDLPPSVQVALLRFLDRKGEYRRLGDMQLRKADVSIVSSTNRDLEQLVEKGLFRADLWYRLNGEIVRIPPLRERPADVRAFIERWEWDLLPGLRAIDVIEHNALEFLLAQPWPGNFRELENFLGRLPSELANGKVSIDGCRKALRQKAPSTPEQLAPTAVSPLSMDRWTEVQQRATAAWIEDHQGEAPRAWAELGTFQEEYLKPVFVAYAAGKQDVTQITRTINFAQIAKQLDLSDGARAKAYLQRYIERFRRPQSKKE